MKEPCSGEIVAAVDGVVELSPPHTDPEVPPSGNHVILRCGSVYVPLAHFRRGSLKVAAGQHVVATQPLAEIGNSGRSDEPHLHVHAQLTGTAAEPLSGLKRPGRSADGSNEMSAFGEHGVKRQPPDCSIRRRARGWAVVFKCGGKRRFGGDGLSSWR